MKKKILLLMGVFSLGLLQAQVGVNTQKPLGVFHIDPKSNTGGTASVPTNDSDDFIVTKNGNVGVGTANPLAKLHIKTAGTSASPISGLRISDTNEADGRVLVTTTSDGRATWRDLIGSWYAIMQNGSVPYQTALQITPVKFQSYAVSELVPGFSVNLNEGSLTVPYDGFYRIIIDGYCNINYSRPSELYDGNYIVMYRLLNGTTSGVPNTWTPHIMVSQSFGEAYVSQTLITRLFAGDNVQFNLAATTTEYANFMRSGRLMIDYLYK